MSEVQYGNGGKVKYAYDDYDRLTGVKYDEEIEKRYIYEYDASGNAVTVRDNHLGRVFQTEHDLTDRSMGTQLRNTDGSLIYRTELDYDPQNRLVGFGEETENDTYKTNYTYDNDNRVTEVGFGGDDKVKYTYDSLGRVSTRVVENGIDAGKLTSTYTFVDGGHGAGSTTPLIKKIDQPHIPFEYEYDTRGNIISEKRGELTTTYAYDALGQLIRVNDPHENATWVYNYDRGGNILSKAKYAYTTETLGSALETIPCAYGDANWKDKLTSYNGHPITYDAIGNPLNDGTWTYTWSAGRQLKQMSKPGMTVEFKYDHNGLRIQKKVTEDGTVTTADYIYHGKLLTHITVGNDYLHFFYDSASCPAKVSYNGIIYTYVHNLQGDVVGIIDSSGTLVVEYQYDVWGNLNKSGYPTGTLGNLNPFRYRKYTFDEETGLYYLRERYYNPHYSRMLNMDSIMGKKGIFHHNAFLYTLNNPIIHVDPSGRTSITVYISNWFGNLIDEIKRKPALLAAGSLAAGVYADYKATAQKELTIPTYKLDGKMPNNVQITKYTVKNEHKNLFGGGITQFLNAIAQNGMGDAINYVSMYYTGTPLVGDSFDDILSVASEVSTNLLGEIHNVTVHTLTVEYSYDNNSAIIANYWFYSSNDGCMDHYDGIHVWGVVQLDGWYPKNTFRYTYDLN